MLKRLAVPGKWLLWVVLVAGTVAAVTYKSYQTRVKYQSDCEQYARQIATLSGQKTSSADDCKDPKDYMPWWYALIAWPEGITTWAIMLTLFVIAKQTYETRRAADAGAEAANAAYASVAFAEAQFELMKEKERARLDIDVGPIEVTGDESMPFGWELKAVIKLRNIGASRAYVIRTAGDISVSEDDGTSLRELGELDFFSLPDRFLDPDTVPIEIDRWFFSQGAAMKEFADDLHNGKKSIYLHGNIQYETMGFRWQRDFRFRWKTFGNFSALAIFGRPGTDPESDARRIASGYWQPDPESQERPIDRNPETDKAN